MCMFVCFVCAKGRFATMMLLEFGFEKCCCLGIREENVLSKLSFAKHKSDTVKCHENRESQSKITKVLLRFPKFKLEQIRPNT